jgi:hypothetical protein
MQEKHISTPRMKSLKIGESIAFNVSFQRIQIWGGG